VFRRRREVDETDEGALDDAARNDLDDADGGETDREVSAEPTRPVVEQGPTTGPWDAADLPKGDATPRVDLGGLAVPIPEGIELRVEVAEDVVVAAALVDGPSQLVVNAFAAPRSAGLWDEVRNEIADSLTSGGGSAEHAEGAFGTELRARIPDETGGSQQARFVGVDGPRWFLRGLITGPAATDSAQASRLDEVFRAIVVVRGTDAMAPRDPVPLHLPRDIVEQAAEHDGEHDHEHDIEQDVSEDEEGPRLQLQERGPEITELR
jgi:Protein of unknown function (DUF3710)